VEVHAAHGPLNSVKEFMLHLLAITIGLLLALGLEASVEWVHHHNLVREAKDNIMREVRDNRRNLAMELNSLPAEKSQLEGLLRSVNDIQHGRAAKVPPGMDWAAVHLFQSAWNTSASSGATAYMNYAEAKAYSQVYVMQDLYNSMMDRYLRSRFEMFGLLMRLSLSDKPSAAEFEAGKRAITEQIVTGQGLLEVGRGIDAIYEGVSRAK
jgi:hypothetical protein